jgi:N-acetylglucosaminyldiphosphoundecaprenol N-acetyl-beta-D-mannosaminyltransferase
MFRVPISVTRHKHGQMRRYVDIIGITFVDMAFDEALAELARAVDERARKTVHFANAATLNLAADDAHYRVTLNDADYVYGDGTGVRWAARLRGVKLQSNLNGTDLVPALIEGRPGIRVFLLGGTDELIEAAARQFRKHFPQANLVGAHHGYFDHADSGEIIAHINSTQPDLLLVGFGNPLQERWIARHRHLLDVPLTAGVGGLFAYWAGTLTRAPEVYRRLGMEWLHILQKQPHKARRYLIGNPLFLLRMMSWLPADSGRRAA